MTDRYQAFANSPLGKLLVKNLGLPMPVTLDRFDPSKPLVGGPVYLGAAAGSSIIDGLTKDLKDMDATVYTDKNPEVKLAADKAGLKTQTYDSSDKSVMFKGLVYDASGIKNSEQLIELFNFFGPVARQVMASGRVVVFGRQPELCKDPKHATAQRALEGFVKSVGKEFKKGVTAQLVYVADGAENDTESTMRFLLSAKSAYVSGQVVRIYPAKEVKVDWSLPLKGKVALVTGASRGIGEAIARVLARDGAFVIALDVPPQEEDLKRVIGDIGGAALPLDITAADAGQKIAEFVKDKGGLDIIVHNAGITRDKTLANMKEQQWSLVMNINLSSEERINQYLLDKKSIKENGRIICVSSISGIAGNLGQTNYAASKAGVIGMVQATAPLLKDHVTINAVAPGFIETQMTAAIPLAIREAGRRMNSMQQGGLPVDVAETVAWFANPDSAGLNGNIVRVCGQSLLGA